MCATKRRFHLSTAAALGLALAACTGSDGLGGAEGELLVSPSTLLFERGFVGHEVEAGVRLQNTGRTELVVEVEIEGPFSTPAGPYHLPGGADVTKPVAFAPRSPGEHQGVVRYRQGSRVFEVSLAGRALVPETCHSPGPCFETFFDPATETCVTRELAEGASCQTENSCLVDGICMNRECRGTPRDCDDGNACTVDRCDPKVGCVHEALICPAPANPCQVAACHPASGCGTENLRDGTACGDTSSCVARYHCFQGECTEYDPEGRPCTAGCGRGVCRDDVCHRDDPLAVDPPGFATEPVASDRELLFPGIVSPEGVVPWLEVALDGSVSYLAALAPEEKSFAVRYRNVPLPGVPGAAGAMLAGDSLVIALDRGEGGQVLERRLLADGSPVGEPLALPTLFGVQADDLAVAALVDERGPGGDRAGAVRVVATTGGATAVVSLDPEGVPGPVAWLHGTPVVAAGAPAAVADADGRLYLVLDSPDSGRRIVSLFGDGSPRWEWPAEAGEGGPLAVAEGRLVVAPGRVLDAADGVPSFDLPLAGAEGLPGPAPSPLLGLSAGYGIRWGDPPALPALVAFDPVTGETAGTLELLLPGVPDAGSWTAPVLTSEENAVVAVQVVPEGEDASAMLASGFLEVRPNGLPARACLVPDLGQLSGPPVLRNGWFAFGERRGSVKLYELKRGADLATWGWSGPRGGPGGGNREGW